MTTGVGFVVAILSGIALIAQTPAQSPPPVFRSGVDIVQIDVSVLGKDGKPITGLKAGDFTILEDGQPEQIVAFDEIRPHPTAPPSAAWMRDVPPDVESNDLADTNYFLIVLDDATLVKSPGDPNTGFKLNGLRATAKRVIAGMTAGDQAAVVYTWDNLKGQGFTSDRSKLLKAVDAFTIGPRYDCAALLAASSVLQAAVESMRNIPHRRKTLIFLSVGLDVPLMGAVSGTGSWPSCQAEAQADALQAMHVAQSSNVNIYGADLEGLRPDARITNVEMNFLQDLSDSTGGRAIINTNDVPARMDGILDEAHSYYLIGYQMTTPATDGRFHRIAVKVDRPGAEAHTRSSRYDPPPKPVTATPPTEAQAAVGDYLPRTELRIEASTAPFATSGPEANVEIALGVRIPPAKLPSVRDEADLLVRAFTVDGRDAGSSHEHIPVTLELVSGQGQADGPDSSHTFDLSSRLPLKPGRYSLRIAVHSKLADKTGSVYTDVIVPDFTKDPLSLSGVILTGSSGSSIRGDALNALVPTTTRVFTADDRVQAFVRVYQSASSAASAAAMHVRIVDEHDVRAMDRAETLPAGAFAREHQADYLFRLPLSTLKPGQYLLWIEASAGKKTASRNVRFTIK